MKKIIEKAEKYWLIALILIFLPTVWALFKPGFFGVSDDIHIAWLYEMDRSIKTGQFPPRYVPDLSYGFGYPLFNFVYPLPFYIGEILHKVGFSFVDSIKGVFLLATLSSGVFMYLFLKKFQPNSLAVLGASIYMYAPYRATDLYVRGAIGEIVSFTFLPLVALAVFNLTDEGIKNYKKWLAIGGLSIALLILSHNISTYMFMPFILSLGSIRVFLNKKDRVKKGLYFGLSVIWGLLISLYFWLPALKESSLLKYDTVFDFRDHYPTLIQLIKPYFGYGASVPGPYDGLSFFLGWGILIALVLGTLVFCFKFKTINFSDKVIFYWALVSFLIVVFMMNFRSTYLWYHLPLLPYFQFPWRFLIMTTFLAPLFLLPLKKIKNYNYLSAILLLIIIGLSFWYFRPEKFLYRQDNYYLNRYIPLPSASQDYRYLNEEYLRLPKQNQFRPSQNYPIFFPYTDRINSINDKDGLNTDFKVSSSVPFAINYSKYNFPGWQLKINDKYFPIETGAPFGQITLNLPAGSYSAKLQFSETPFRLALDIISLISLIVGLVFLFTIRLPFKK